jgi:hypothetical protein
VRIKRAVNKNHKRLQKKSMKPRKSIKLSSADWYQKAAARVSIKSSWMKVSPSLVPQND